MQKMNLAAVVAGIVCLVVLLSSYLIFVHNDVLKEKNRYEYIAKDKAEHIISTVDCIMARTQTLKVMIRDHNGETEFFGDVADEVYDSVKEETGIELKNLIVAPGGVVSKVYPYEGNERLIGFDFLDDGMPGNSEAIEAYESGKMVLTNPFDLIQGGVGIAGRTPVFLDKKDPDTPWGLVSVTIDYEDFTDSQNLDSFTDMGIYYRLAAKEPDGQTRVLESNCDNLKDPVISDFNIRNLEWTIAVAPMDGWYSAWKIVFVSFVLILLSVLAGCFVNLLFRLRSKNKKLWHTSNTDELTGCNNRRAYERRMKGYQSIAPTGDFIYAAVDINGLKNTNDTLGHDAGDELIRGAAESLRHGFGACGDIYRTGGDEFVIMLTATDEELKRIDADLKTYINEWKGELVSSLSISVGYAGNREFPDMTINELAKTADQRMYEEKRAYYLRNGNDRRNRS